MPNLSREEKHFSFFKEHFEFGNKENIVRSESPDFLVKLNGNIIGIEHTEIFIEKNYPLQACESIQDDICKLATQYAHEKSYVPTLTKVNFGNIQGLKQQERIDLAKEIADFVQKNVLLTNCIKFMQLKLDPEIRTIRNIFVTIAPEEFKNHYQPVRVGWGKVNATAEIYRSIKKKAQKLNSYSSRCDEIWLLVAADGYKPSSFLGRDSNVEPLPSLHGFNRVYFMFYLSKQLQEVFSVN
ncbi:MAG: hypothetical protein WEB02_00455 [Methylophaga sp.]